MLTTWWKQRDNRDRRHLVGYLYYYSVFLVMHISYWTVLIVFESVMSVCTHGNFFWVLCFLEISLTTYHSYNYEVWLLIFFVKGSRGEQERLLKNIMYFVCWEPFVLHHRRANIWTVFKMWRCQANNNGIG
jgi:hypothetical protein